jgi:hypothetical protein
MSEAWQYGVQKKNVATFCWSIDEQLRRCGFSPEQFMIELVTQLEEENFSPESWHLILKQLRRQFTEHPSNKEEYAPRKSLE